MLEERDIVTNMKILVLSILSSYCDSLMYFILLFADDLLIYMRAHLSPMKKHIKIIKIILMMSLTYKKQVTNSKSTNK